MGLCFGKPRWRKLSLRSSSFLKKEVFLLVSLISIFCLSVWGRTAKTPSWCFLPIQKPEQWVLQTPSQQLAGGLHGTNWQRRIVVWIWEAGRVAEGVSSSANFGSEMQIHEVCSLSNYHTFTSRSLFMFSAPGLHVSYTPILQIYFLKKIYFIYVLILGPHP